MTNQSLTPKENSAKYKAKIEGWLNVENVDPEVIAYILAAYDLNNDFGYSQCQIDFLEKMKS